MAVSAIAPPASSSSAPVLPPGAAQASSTRSPGRGASNSAASCALESCTDTRPASKPGTSDNGGGRIERDGGVDARRPAAPCRSCAGELLEVRIDRHLRGIDAQAQRRMFIVGRQDRFELLGPRRLELRDQPVRMRAARGQLPIDRGQARIALAQETAQDGIDQPGRVLEPQEPRGIDRRGHRGGVRMRRVFEADAPP